MNYYTTTETAIALRDAGFPQPTPEIGQYWYRAFKGHTITSMCSDVDNDGEPLYSFTDTFSRAPGSFMRVFGRFSDEMNTMIFAPTATDILRELGSGYYLTHENTLFQCASVDDYGHRFDYWTDKNPAEACAKAWLEKNKPVSS